MKNQISIATNSYHYPFIVTQNAIHYLPEFIDRSVTKIMIVTDEHIAAHHLSKMQAVLELCSCPYTYVVLPSGEETKSFFWLERLIRHAIEEGLDRSSLFIAFGGGVIGDLTGFAASIYMRGIPYIQIPTTLLAHDSSIGGKVAINHELGKNLVGSFHHPMAVLFDPQFLFTLDRRSFLSGFAEMIKHAVIRDARFFEWLEINVHKLVERDVTVLEQAIRWSVSIKAAIIQQDERDYSLRQLLNYGHTIGHGIEKFAEFELLHGEAVAIGMMLESKIATRFCQYPLEVERIEALLKKFQLPTAYHVMDVDALLEIMERDKKAHKGKLMMALPSAIGQAQMVEVHHRWVQEVIENEKESDCKGGF